MSNPIRVAELLDTNILWINGQVCRNMYTEVLQSITLLEKKGSPDIEVRFCSDGGNVKFGLDIYDILCNYKGKKTGVVYSLAWSMGAVILQACDIRTCLPHGQVRIHYVAEDNVSYGDYMQPKIIEERKESLGRSQMYIDEIMIKQTGKTKKQLYKSYLEDKPMTAQEAISYGLIDGVYQQAK